MALQHGLFTLALSALLLAPVAAKADDGRWGGSHEAVPVAAPRVEQFHGGHRPPPPMPARSRGSRQDGRYELQTVHQQVPGYYEQVWTAESCTPHPYRRGMRCVPAHSEQRWVPGYTQTTQEWVWIPWRPSRYGRG